MDNVWLVLVIVVGYFLGNISPSTIIGRINGVDIKKEGSGNAGTTNALRVLGKKAAIITLVVDVLKGVIAVELGFMVSGNLGGMLCCLAAFAGHCWPILLKFKGGKGVATAFGGILAVNWQLALISLAIVAVVVLISRMVSLGAITVSVCFPVIAYFLDRDFFWIGVIMALILLFNHRANFMRIIKGEENKLSFKK